MRPPGEFRRPKRPGVDRLRIDVDGHLAVVLLDELLELAYRRLVLGDAAGEGELVGHAARTRDDRHRAQNDGAVQAGENVLALLAEREAVAQLGAGKYRAGRIDARRPVRLHGERTELVQPHVHLIGDVAEI